MTRFIHSISPLRATMLIFALCIASTISLAFSKAADQAPTEPVFVEEMTTTIRARLLNGESAGITVQVFTPVALEWHEGDVILVRPSDDCHDHYDLTTDQRMWQATVLEDLLPTSK